MIRRLRQRSLQRPASSESVEYPVSRHSKFSAPLGNGQGLTTESEQNGATTVSGVLISSRPLTVFRRVASVIVAAFQGVSIVGARPHVLKEESKRLSPTPANSYSSATVTIEGMGIRIFTSLDHRAINAVLWQAIKRAARSLLVHLGFKAPAGSRAPRDYGAGSNLFFSPAGALAPAPIMIARQHCQSAKGISWLGAPRTSARRAGSANKSSLRNPFLDAAATSAENVGVGPAPLSCTEFGPVAVLHTAGG